MSAKPTAADDPPVPLIGGPHGQDSPTLPQLLPRFRWCAWIDLAEDRAAGRRTPLSTIEWALGHGVNWKEWPLWWLALDEQAAWWVHVAQVTTVEGGGQMLLAACLRSAPWLGEHLDYNVALRAGVTPAKHWDRCEACAVLA